MLLALASPAPARTVAEKKQAARTYFDEAEQLRAEMNARPVNDRTRQEYQRVTDAYRRVYYTAPTSSKADAAVTAVAELLAETGRRFNDPKLLHSAIEQYQFLRREYPGSKGRVDALFTIGQIYKEDLNDREQAKASFEEFLKRYPASPRLAEVKAALADLEHPERKKKEAREPEPRESVTPSLPKGSPRPLVTSIRHWSTPDYTRVAIDLEAEVQYQAGRVPSPDRIFFDLHETRLASALMGKTFDVQDGFLRKIRVAQYVKGITRVVLEVDDVSDYSAFLLPNPYRLIIDIHGRQQRTQQLAKKDAPAALEVPLPAPREVAKPEPAAKKPAVETAKSEPSKPEPRGIEVSKIDLKMPAPPNGRVADGTTSPLKPDLDEAARSARPARPAENPSAKPEGESSTRARSRTTESSSPRARSTVAKAEPAREATKPALPPVVKTESKSAPEMAKSTEPKLEKAVEKKINDEPDSEALTLAKLNPPDLKTSKPTSAPTFESIAPRAGTVKGRRRPADPAAHEARPTANGERSLIRALGLKIGRIVVDAGHGGHDTGTIGPNGLQEKDLVLDVALRLGKLLESKLGADVIYTRDNDTFIPLETRTAVANQNQADLFISIHANSSNDASARGVETYYLNFTSSADALEVAARENAVSEKSIHELQDLVKKIALKEKIEESREFAADVQRSLWNGVSSKSPAVRNRGVKKAPFIVLIGANMPSILAEISFLSNPTDEKRLLTPEYRQKIAEYLYNGIRRYVSGLSGVKLAQQKPLAAGN